MNLATVADQLAAAIQTVPDLADRTFAYPVATVGSLPCAVVSLPDTISWGHPEQLVAFPVMLLVGRPTDRTARDRVLQYLQAIKTAVDNGTYTACDAAFCESAVVDMVAISGTEYLSLTITVSVAGSQ